MNTPFFRCHAVQPNVYALLAACLAGAAVCWSCRASHSFFEVLLRQFAQRQQSMDVAIGKMVAAGESQVPVVATGG